MRKTCGSHSVLNSSFHPSRWSVFTVVVKEKNSDGKDEKAGEGSNNTDRILNRIRRSGKFVGVAERFALGVRGPMTLLCGFTGVPLKAFAAGVALGALFGTVPIQLALGYVLRDRPTTVGAIGAAFFSFYTFSPPIMAAVGGVTLWLGRKKDGKEKEEKKEVAAVGEEELELGEEGAGI